MDQNHNIHLSVDAIIEALLPRVTEERAWRLQQVVAQRTHSIAPVLENIYDRGNTSAVMRSAEAFGFMDFYVVEQPGVKFKAANRVAKGTDHWLNQFKYQDVTKCLSHLKQRGYQLVATHLQATTFIDEIDFTRPTAIIFGNEKDGVSAEALQLCDQKFIVPMVGFAQSFNISVAAALCFYHAYQYRVRYMGASGDLSADEKRNLLADYLRRSVGASEQILRQLTNK